MKKCKMISENAIGKACNNIFIRKTNQKKTRKWNSEGMSGRT